MRIRPVIDAVDEARKVQCTAHRHIGALLADRHDHGWWDREMGYALTGLEYSRGLWVVAVAALVRWMHS